MPITLRRFLFVISVVVVVSAFLSLSIKEADAGGTCGTAEPRTCNTGVGGFPAVLCHKDPNNCDSLTPRCSTPFGDTCPTAAQGSDPSLCEFQCINCASDNDCVGRFGNLNYCYLAGGNCVECPVVGGDSICGGLYGSDPGDNRFCNTGVCTSCRFDDNDCPSGFNCDINSHQCVPENCESVGEPCAASAECCAPAVCVSAGGFGVCTDPPPTTDCNCADDSECGTDQTCDETPGICQHTGTGETGLCTDDPNGTLTYSCNPNTGSCNPDPSSSQDYNSCISGCIINPTPAGPPPVATPFLPPPIEPNELIVMILRLLVPVSLILAILRIIQGGYMILTSQGNETQLVEGKQIITSAVVGLIMAITGITIINIILNTFIGPTT